MAFKIVDRYLLLVQASLVKFLLETGVDVNASDSNGQTALMAASRKNHTKIVEFLKAHGADD